MCCCVSNGVSCWWCPQSPPQWGTITASLNISSWWCQFRSDYRLRGFRGVVVDVSDGFLSAVSYILHLRLHPSLFMAEWDTTRHYEMTVQPPTFRWASIILFLRPRHSFLHGKALVITNVWVVPLNLAFKYHLPCSIMSIYQSWILLSWLDVGWKLGMDLVFFHIGPYICDWFLILI